MSKRRMHPQLEKALWKASEDWDYWATKSKTSMVSYSTNPKTLEFLITCYDGILRAMIDMYLILEEDAQELGVKGFDREFLSGLGFRFPTPPPRASGETVNAPVSKTGSA